MDQHTPTRSNDFFNPSTTFPMDEEYQEASRLEMFHKYKAEIYEQKKSKIKWKQKYERMKPMIFAINKKAKNKENRFKRGNEKRKQKKEEQ